MCLLNEEFKKGLDTHEKVKALKVAATNSGNFSLAAELREFEKEKYPQPNEKEIDDAYTKAMHFRTLMAMVEINMDTHIAYRVARAFDVWEKKKGKTSLNDTSKIIAESNEYFK